MDQYFESSEETHMINYINACLDLQNLPRIERDSTAWMQTMYHLLNTQQKEAGANHQLESYTERLNSDLTNLNLKFETLSCSYSQLQRDYSASQQQLQQAHQQVRQAIDQANKAKEQLRQGMTAIKQKQNQLIHEQRRKEQEMEKIKTKVERVLKERIRESGIGIAFEERFDIVEGNFEESLSSEILMDYEEKAMVLINENSSLRRGLGLLYQACSKLVPESAELDALIVDDEQFSMPMEWMNLNERIEQMIQFIEPLGLLEERYHARGDEISELKQQLTEYSRVLEEQNRILEEQHISRTNTEAIELQQERNQLMEERKKFSEAAMKLGLERAAFQKEKEEFLCKKPLNAPGTPQWLTDYMSKNPNVDASVLDDLMKSPLGRREIVNPFVEKENQLP